MTPALEFTGRFGGFVFTDAGKRRMLLREGEQQRLLKVPRVLRRRIIGKFPVGQWIRVAVTEERNPDTGVLKQVVSQVLPEAGNSTIDRRLPLTGKPVAASVVRVCSKKNCWRNGGRELFAALGHELAANGQAGNVEIRQVGCLDRCKQAPNIDCGDRAYTRCSAREAGTIIARASGSLSCHEIGRE